MTKNSTYADHVAVEHTAQMLKMTIAVYEKDNHHCFGDYEDSAMVGYLRDINHNVSLQPIRSVH